jgi:hypothetical protein
MDLSRGLGDVYKRQGSRGCDEAIAHQAEVG